MKNNELIAYIDDMRVQATVVFLNNTFHVFYDGEYYPIGLEVRDYSNTGSVGKGSLFAPMPGKVTQIMVENGQKVKKGATLMVMEAMKMEV